ncbi:HAMP domain-containing sensor histidine kinase [Thalassomonas sp. RHCl1]|uniref:sensor histidine kinase n=1 Tax=Thalassomonas sp. RHCl1 TaxID=2995320 RepID=UPI00248B7BD3|nr:HAMP domain-containing sensor histidine kinase [Thalassomonas sp. RHCl1]
MKRFNIMYLVAVAVMMLLGISTSIFTSVKVREAAEQSWLNDGFRQAEQISNIFISWLDREKETFKGITSLYYATGDISQEEFEAAIKLIEQTEDTIRTLSIAFVVPTAKGGRVVDLAAGGRELWQANYPLPDIPEIDATLQRAFLSPEKMIVGPIFKAGDDNYKVILGFALQSGVASGVLLSTVDISNLLDGLIDLYVPGGLNISLLLENQELLLMPQLNPVNQGAIKAEKVLRIMGVGKEWYFNWQVHDSYKGGPDIVLATAIMLGGSIITLLLSALTWIQALQNERISQKVNEKTEQLQKTQTQLIHAEKMAALGSLVAGVSHELNTPIGNSLVASSSLKERMVKLKQAFELGTLKKSTLEESLHQAIDEADLIELNIYKATELIGSFKQVSTDQTSDRKRKFELKQALEDVIKTMSPMLKQNHLCLEADIEADIAMDSYPGPLGQVIANFVNNSMVHAFENTENGKMSLKAYALGEDKVKLIYRDNGCGIEKGMVNRIFEPFYTTKLGKGGSGLGLNIVYNIIINVLAGEISVSSELGKGTTFTLILPRVAD